MVKEEYRFNDVADYLDQNIDLLIAGNPRQDERSHFFIERWMKMQKDILILEVDQALRLNYNFIHGSQSYSGEVDLCYETTVLFQQHLNIERKRILLDLTSLNHVLIMFLAKQLIQKTVPRGLFAAYIRPERYNVQPDLLGSALSDRIQAVEAVPGFTKRESKNQTLCAFLGFEGIRLNNILEAVHDVDRFIPVVAFPSGNPHWYKITVWNTMDILQSEYTNSVLCKCLSESVFDAVALLEKNVGPGDKVVLAPLGTRPHSLACAIFACNHANARIVYDFVIEQEHRAIGISNITIYHLSSFLQV